MGLVMTVSATSQSRITQEHRERAAEIVRQMTLEEKIAYIGGYRSWYIRAVDRLGLPAIRMADGPQGVRNNTRSTLYPSGIAAAATWDRELINKMGVALGQDSRARGVHILLGPGTNMYRSPLCGRNFEYFGEDPYLAGEVATNYITGVQSQGVMTCIKHFAGNNQEFARHSVSSDIDERTLHEIYFPAFEKAVKKGDVAAVMTSYNLLNGVHASESKYLNYDILRDAWGFEGIVISDWKSCYSPLNVATWGVDIEMPTPMCMKPDAIMDLIKTGMLDERYIDRKCQHIIQSILAYEFDKRPQIDKSIPENNPYSDSVALELSRASAVLLKNEDNFLPIKKGNFYVCGPNADKIVTGGGSGFVTPLISTSVAKGMSDIDKKIKTFVSASSTKEMVEDAFADKNMTMRGVSVEIFPNTEFKGKPIHKFISKDVFFKIPDTEAHDDINTDNISSRYTFYFKPTADISYRIELRGNDGCRMFINKQKVADEWGLTGSGTRNAVFRHDFKKNQVYEVIVEHFNTGGSVGLTLNFESDNDQNLEKLRKADCVVACLGFEKKTEQEGRDRTFELPKEQMEYLRAILEVNKNVVVILNGGGSIEMASWLPEVKAVIMAWYPGQQGGTALSEIITGKISPSGKLPISIESRIEDNPCSANYHENVPRMRDENINPYSRVEYREGIFTGYRGYEKNDSKPLFPFGYGLSYTSFEYSDINVTEQDKNFIINFKIKNTGKVSASEIAQVYVTDDECSVVRPKKELKGFQKVFLKPGEAKAVSITLDEEAFRFYDAFQHKFVVEPGQFTISVGASSADIRLTTKLAVK